MESPARHFLIEKGPYIYTLTKRGNVDKEKRERIIMDALGGDYLIRKRSWYLDIAFESVKEMRSEDDREQDKRYACTAF
uniref:Uncharacterized protein n=1 Tax=Parascaris equorum TaxID=6256 RepID=A0A914RXG9_PAREQ